MEAQVVDIRQHTVKACADAMLEYSFLQAILDGGEWRRRNVWILANIHTRHHLLGTYILTCRELLKNTGVTVIDAIKFYDSDTGDLLYEPSKEDYKKHHVPEDFFENKRDKESVDNLLKDLDL